MKSIEETLGEPELSYEKQLIEQRLAIINNTLAKIKTEKPAKLTKHEKKIEEMGKEIEKLKEEMGKIQKRKTNKNNKLKTLRSEAKTQRRSTHKIYQEKTTQATHLLTASQASSKNSSTHSTEPLSVFQAPYVKPYTSPTT